MRYLIKVLYPSDSKITGVLVFDVTRFIIVMDARKSILR